jgi:DNA-binding protein H-NS
MTTTSQALRGNEKDTYEKILKRFETLSAAKQKELAKVQAKIISDAIKSEPATRERIRKKMADLIRGGILEKRSFNPDAEE